MTNAIGNAQSDGTQENDEGTKINWGRVARRDPHGAIDLEATMALLNTELVSHMAENEVDMEAVKEAVAVVFNKLTSDGKALNAMIDLNGLSSRACMLLAESTDVPYGAETQLQERIKDFVRGESDHFVKSNGEEGAYWICRGKRGGVRLGTDACRKDFRALQDKKAKATAAGK